MEKELVEQSSRRSGARYSRVQRKGQVTIPVELRAKLGIEEGDLVTFTETPEGILLSSNMAKAMRALDEMAAIMQAEGISLEDLIESGREIRGEIFREKYAKLLDK